MLEAGWRSLTVVVATIDGDVHRELAQQMGIRSYPTTVIVSPEMQVVAKITGFRTADSSSLDGREKNRFV